MIAIRPWTKFRTPITTISTPAKKIQPAQERLDAM
jgi:hypothetical protein